VTNKETAILAASLITPLIGVLFLGYFAAQGSRRADSVLRWAVPVYVVGATLLTVITLVRFDHSEAWSASGIVVVLAPLRCELLSDRFGLSSVHIDRFWFFVSRMSV